MIWIKLNMNNSNDNGTFTINLNLISSIIFILASLVSLALTFDEKGNITGGKKYLTDKQALDISFYNRIVILIAVLISLYAGYKNYKSENNDTARYKSSLLLSTSVLSLIGALIILYVAYLNKKEQSLTVSDVENPLI